MQTRKDNLTAYRAAAGATNWTSALGVLATVQERTEWSKSIEKDSSALRTAKLVGPSPVFDSGVMPLDAPSVQLQKLLIKAAKSAGVVLPKKLVVDVAKEAGLVEAYAQL
jgi:hypothetical protein